VGIARACCDCCKPGQGSLYRFWKLMVSDPANRQPAVVYRHVRDTCSSRVSPPRAMSASEG
jgi:hypothetical protein